MPERVSKQLADLSRVAVRLANSVVENVRNNRNCGPLLESCADMAYVKNSHGEVITANSSYMQTFNNGQSVLGRKTSDFLHASIKESATLSDQLILAGTRIVVMEHPGRIASEPEKAYKFFTAKVSLLDHDIAPVAILGITQIAEPTLLLSAGRDRLLDRWHCFEKLTAENREISIILSTGKMPREIADHLQLSVRTVEQRRQEILRQLSLENTIQLAQLLAKFQWFGLDDFGVE